MKNFSIFLFVIIIGLPVSAQINPGQFGLQPIENLNFESNNPRLKIDQNNPNNDWQVGSTVKPFFGSALSMPKAIMTDTVNSYSNGNHSYFDLCFAAWEGVGYPGNMYVQFDHKYETDSLLDGGYITVSYDSGQTFTNVIQDANCFICSNGPYPNLDNMYDTTQTLVNGEYGFTGTANWTTSTFQWIWILPVRKSIYDSLIIRFNFISDSIQTNKDGWIIDNIEIGDVYLGSSVEEFGADVQISIYPNLTTDYFNYEIDGAELEQISITNIQGQTVMEKTTTKSKGRIDVSNLPSGNYFVRFSSGQKARIKRLVIN